MRALVGIIALTGLAGPVLAETTARPPASELATAIGFVAGRRIEINDIKVGICHGPEEEPTEFECSWQQKIGGRWHRLKSWFFIDRDGWNSQCPVGHSMECFGIKAKSAPSEK
jgi:hypothetical protein